MPYTTNIDSLIMHYLRVKSHISRLSALLFHSLVLLDTSSSQSYYPLIKEDAVWYIGHWQMDWHNPDLTNLKGTKWFIDDDTIIDSLNYRFIYGSSTDTLQFSKSKKSSHLIREDSMNRVFIRYGKYNTDSIVFHEEIILYDFSMQPGDSIVYYGQNKQHYEGCLHDSVVCRLKSIDTVVLSGKSLRRYTLERNANPQVIQWYEGIGTVDLGLFGPFCDNFESGEVLGCYIDNQIYMNLSTPCS